MHDHDLDLIAAYADGSLDGPADEARRLVESCARCRAEYELQREVRSLLGDVAPVSLTGEERARARTAVFQSLENPAPVVDLASRRTRRWVAVGSAAAGVLVLVGLAGALGGLRGGDSGGSDDLATVARTEEAADAGEADAPHMMLTPETTVAAATEGAESASPLDLGSVSLDDLREAVAREVERLEAAGPVDDRSAVTGSDLECAHLVAQPVLERVRAIIDGERVVVYLTGTETGVAVHGYRADDCLALNLD